MCIPITMQIRVVLVGTTRRVVRVKQASVLKKGKSLAQTGLLIVLQFQLKQISRRHQLLYKFITSTLLIPQGIPITVTAQHSSLIRPTQWVISHLRKLLPLMARQELIRLTMCMTRLPVPRVKYKCTHTTMQIRAVLDGTIWRVVRVTQG